MQKPLFPVILQIFGLEYNNQASLKIALVKFGHIFMKFRKLKSLHLENEKLDCHKTWDFHYISHSLFFGAKLYLQSSKCYFEFLIDVIRLDFGELFNWIQINIVFKCSHSSMLSKIGIFKNFTEFTWKHLRSVTLIKWDFSAAVFLRI